MASARQKITLCRPKVCILRQVGNFYVLWTDFMMVRFWWLNRAVINYNFESFISNDARNHYKYTNQKKNSNGSKWLALFSWNFTRISSHKSYSTLRAKWENKWEENEMVREIVFAMQIGHTRAICNWNLDGMCSGANMPACAKKKKNVFHANKLDVPTAIATWIECRKGEKQKKKKEMKTKNLNKLEMENENK